MHAEPRDMRSVTSVNVSVAALRLYPQLQRIAQLRDGGGWVFQLVQADGRLDLLTGVRLWPWAWSDAIAIRDLGDAKAFRCDPDGGEVWRHEGGLVEVVDALLELPAPDEPGAPQLVKAKAPELWTPQPRMR